MYSSIQVYGYRGFDSCRLSGLGNVNLLVGVNNSGKTSILECIELLQSGGNPEILYSILSRRGETARVNGRILPVVRHLFAGHDVAGRRLMIAGEECGKAPHQISLYSEDSEGGELLPSADSEPEDSEFEDEELTPYVLHVDSSAMTEPFRTKMTSTGVLPEFSIGPALATDTPGTVPPDRRYDRVRHRALLLGCGPDGKGEVCPRCP